MAQYQTHIVHPLDKILALQAMSQRHLIRLVVTLRAQITRNPLHRVNMPLELNTLLIVDLRN